jgi:hypothetical protein
MLDFLKHMDFDQAKIDQLKNTKKKLMQKNKKKWGEAIASSGGGDGATGRGGYSNAIA